MKWTLENRDERLSDYLNWGARRLAKPIPGVSQERIVDGIVHAIDKWRRAISEEEGES